MSFQQNSKVSIQNLFSQFAQSLLYQFSCSQPARILKYNSKTQRATIELAFIQAQQIYANRTPTLKPQTISNVPVIQPYNKGKGINYPINRGDEGCIVVLDRSKDNWLNGAFPSPVNDTRSHDVNDCVFIVGAHASTTVNPNLDNEAVSIFYNKSLLKVANSLVSIDLQGGGKVSIKNDIISLLTQQIDATNGLKMALDEVVAAINALNASLQGLSNVTLTVSAGGLTAPNGPVTGATSTTTPTVPPVPTTALVSAINVWKGLADKISQILAT